MNRHTEKLTRVDELDDVFGRIVRGETRVFDHALVSRFVDRLHSTPVQQEFDMLLPRETVNDTVEVDTGDVETLSREGRIGIAQVLMEHCDTRIRKGFERYGKDSHTAVTLTGRVNDKTEKFVAKISEKMN